MTPHVALTSTLASRGGALAQGLHEPFHVCLIGLEELRGGIDVGLDCIHHHPQQSVLKRQTGHRHTACIRNISAPHRSHKTLSDAGCGRVFGDGEEAN
jgi:hypothetical protein